jgi:23S rRNA pseudouridine2604 synthase
MVRLSKRMSELDLCSRRQADKWIADNGFSELIWVQGKLVEPTLGVKVAFDEMDIELRQQNGSIVTPQVEVDWSQIRGETIVLYKPVGCVSGQPVLREDGSNLFDYDQNTSSAPVYEHAPAVQLLTRANLQISETDLELSETLRSGNHLHFAKKSFTANHSSISRRGEQVEGLSTLVGYVPAGRLDLDSSGLLIFTKSGVMAKKLVGSRGNLEKEYLVTVEPVQQVSAVEREMGIKTLPSPHYDLKTFKSGGRRLWNDHKPLKPVVKAEWVDEKKKKDATIITTTTTPTNSDDTLPRRTLRVVLKEGRKRQIRRMCREILGQHVVSLQRIRVGSISLLNKDGSASLSEGKWRPLREAEARALLRSESSLRKKKKK